MAEVEKLTSIDSLNIDCLSTIFRHLSIVDRIKIERVNKHWNEVSKSSWSNVKKLNLHRPSWGFRPRGFLLENKKIKLFEFTEVLKRSGKFLEEVDVKQSEEFEERVMSKTFDVISSYCTNIKILVALDYYPGFTVLAEKCKHIVDLTFYSQKFHANHSYDNELSSLFKNNKHLRKLKFLTLPIMTGKCLLSLPLLETLDISCGSLTIETVNLVNAIKVMNDLKVFKINSSHSQINDVIMELKNCSNLEELNLEIRGHDREYDFPDEENRLELLFKNNQKLKILRLKGFRKITGECLLHLNADSIKELAIETCRDFNYDYLSKSLFKLFNLSKFEFRTHNCIDNKQYFELVKFISSLKKLKICNLDLRNFSYENYDFDLTSTMENNSLEELSLIASITVNLVKNFKNLKILNFFYCDITNNGLHAITNLPKLEILSIKFMYKIDDSGLTKMENLKKLILYGCGITTDGLKKVLKESEKLDYLLIKICNDVKKEDFLIFANEITKKRTNDIVLYIHESIFEELENSEILANIKKSPFLEYTDEVIYF